MSEESAPGRGDRNRRNAILLDLTAAVTRLLEDVLLREAGSGPYRPERPSRPHGLPPRSWWMPVVTPGECLVQTRVSSGESGAVTAAQGGSQGEAPVPGAGGDLNAPARKSSDSPRERSPAGRARNQLDQEKGRQE